MDKEQPGMSDDLDDEQGMEEAELEFEETRKRHPGDFENFPSDEQMEYFKRGGR